MTAWIYALSVEAHSRREIASTLGIKKGTVFYHQKKLLKENAIKQVNPYPAQFSKGRYWRRWHSRCSNLNILVEGVVQTSPPFVRIEQMQYRLTIVKCPADLPSWDAAPWEWGNGVMCYTKRVKLSLTRATFTFQGKERITSAKLQLEPFNVPVSELDSIEDVKQSLTAEAIKIASSKWGFGIFPFAEPTIETEYANSEVVKNLQKVHTGEVQLTEHYKVNDSPIDGKRGTPMVETKSLKHAKALAERGEAVVRLEDVANGNRSGILGLAKRMDGLHADIIASVDDKIAYAIEEFGKIITTAFDKLPDAVAKKLNKPYEAPPDDKKDVA